MGHTHPGHPPQSVYGTRPNWPPPPRPARTPPVHRSPPPRPARTPPVHRSPLNLCTGHTHQYTHPHSICVLGNGNNLCTGHTHPGHPPQSVYGTRPNWPPPPRPARSPPIHRSPPPRPARNPPVHRSPPTLAWEVPTGTQITSPALKLQVSSSRAPSLQLYEFPLQL